MEIFFRELLDSMNFEVCSAPHVQGLMHWFTCVPDMDFQYMLDVIHNGNPCKYWAPKGAEGDRIKLACHECMDIFRDLALKESPNFSSSVDDFRRGLKGYNRTSKGVDLFTSTDFKNFPDELLKASPKPSK